MMNRMWVCMLVAFLGTTSASATVCDRALGAKNFDEAFQGRIKTKGTPVERIEAFASENPDQVKVVDGVLMHFEDDLGRGQHARKMVVISTNGLTEKKTAALMKKYVAAVSLNTISFPLSSGGGHLYTRLGSKTLDFINQLSVSDYAVPYSDRLETFLALSESEFENMRTYVQNATDNSEKVLGSFDYQGAATSKGTLKNNKAPRNKGHNCTSWLGLAPVGEAGQPLKDAIGVRWDVHRNPGWWTAYLQTKLPDERVPFVVYMSSDPMATILERVKAGQPFDWNYNLH